MAHSDSDNLSDDFVQPEKKSDEPPSKDDCEASRSASPKAKRKFLFSCQFCSAVFTNKSNRNRHEGHCVSGSQNNSPKYFCSRCNEAFKRKDHLNAHFKKCSFQTTSGSSKKKTPCLIGDCDMEFFHKGTLIQHLESAHHQDITIEPVVLKTFPSIKDFNTWKEKEEQDTYSYFTARKGQASSATKYFYCQHDGSGKLHSKRKTSRCNSRGRIKVGHVCIAKMTVRIESKAVYLEYFPTHSHVCKKEDIYHHPLPEAISRFLDEKLAEKIPATVVYELAKDRFLPKNSAQINDTKANILTKKRVLERGRRKRMARRLHKDDAKAVFLLASQLIEKDDSVLIYKPYGSELVHRPPEINQLPNSKELFMFAFQTERQLDLIKRHGSKILIVDETHGTNHYKYQLLTVMVVDEDRRGCPVAYLITSKSDAATLQYFFTALKSRLGQEVDISCVITDDDPALINSMCRGFSMSLKHLLCKWHVFKSLKDNLRTKVPSDLFEPILSEIKVIMNAEQESLFLKLKAGFISKYEKNPDASKFMAYLETYYWKRAQKWAMCYRNFPHAQVNTTGHIESFHSRLKRNYLKRKVNKRLDDLINILFDVEWDDHCRRIREATAGFSAQPQHIQERHQRGLLMKDDAIMEQALDKLWEIRSASGNSTVYIVERYNESCCSDFCFSKCSKPECHGLCAHLFSCSCPDNHPLCKHIHKVQSFLTRGEPNVIIEDVDFYCFGNTRTHEEPISTENHESVTKTLPASDRRRNTLLESLQNNASRLQQFIDAAQSTAVPEHDLIRVNTILSELMQGIESVEKKPEEVTQIPQMDPVVTFAPNEKLNTQLSQLAAFKRPPKRKCVDDPAILGAKKKSAIENLLNCLPINQNDECNPESVDDPDEDSFQVDENDNSYACFTPPPSYATDPFDIVIHCGEERISLIHLKSLELHLPLDEEVLYRNRDTIFKLGWLYSSIIDAFLFRLSQKQDNVFHLSSDFSSRASMKRSNADFLRKKIDHLKDCRVILAPANVTGDHWVIIAVFPGDKEIRYYDPLHGPLSGKCLALLTQMVSDMKAIYPSEFQWKIKVVQGLSQTDSLNCGPYICQFATQLVQPNLHFNSPLEVRKYMYEVIVSKCMRRMSYFLEQCGKCNEEYNKCDATQHWICCSSCQQWYHESCTNHRDVLEPFVCF